MQKWHPFGTLILSQFLINVPDLNNYKSRPGKYDMDGFKKAVGKAGYEHPVVYNKVVSSGGGYG